MVLAVTGIGAISALGGDARSLAQGLHAGVSGIGPLQRIDTAGRPVHLGAEIPAGVLEDVVEKKARSKYDRIQLATLGAARMAWRGAGVVEAGYGQDELAIVLGSTWGYVDSVSAFYTEAIKEGPAYVSPLMFANTVMNAPAGKIAIELAITGLCSTIATGETSGFDAIDYVRDFVHAGTCGAALVGAGNVLCDILFAGFAETGRLAGSKPGTEEVSRPFDRRAGGVVLGEGAGMLVVEDLERARAKGRPILAEVRGCASAIALDREDREGFAATVAEAMQRALADAGLRPADVSMISASASSDPHLDAIEAAAIKQVFGGLGQGCPPVTAPKSMTGDCLDASSMIQAVAAVCAIQDGRIPPIPGLDPAHAHEDLNYVQRGLERRVDAVLVNAVSCGGKVASVVIGRSGRAGA
ncbi:MAG: hypothetical protein IT372_22610 [Polyangiaceae bacterium]|nr:hypothetical protein [Polyangiaceae bacterium]